MGLSITIIGLGIIGAGIIIMILKLLTSWFFRLTEIISKLDKIVETLNEIKQDIKSQLPII